MLTRQQVTEYRQRGFVIVEQFFSDGEVRAMLAELDRFKREGMIRNVATEGDGRTHSTRAANLQIVPLNDKSRLFRALPFAAKVREAVSMLTGDEPFVRYLDQIFLKPGKHGAGTNWHQDNAYFNVEDASAGVGMWTALHDANQANGTLELVPGAQHGALAHRRDMGSDHHITCDVDESQAVPVIVPAGGVAFFNWSVPHCTRGNKTDKERAGLAYHFLPHAKMPESRRSAPNKPVVITGPDATGGQHEYGEDLNGAWEQEVERLTSTAAVA